MIIIIIIIYIYICTLIIYIYTHYYILCIQMPSYRWYLTLRLTTT